MTSPDSVQGRAADLVGQTRPLGEIDLDDAAAWELLDANPDGLVVCDSAGVIVFVNAHLESLSGHDRIELLGQSVETLVPDAVRGSHRAHRLRYQAAPAIRPMGEERELSIRRKDGAEIPVEISLAPVRIGDAVFAAVGVRDVTRRRADDRARRRLLALLDQVPDAVLLVRQDSYEFDYANRGATVLLGYSHEQLLAMTLKHISPAWTERNASFDLAAIAAQSTPTIEAVIRDRHGADIACEFRVVRTAETEGDDDDAPFIVVARDIRERRNWERRLQANEESFRAAFDQAPVGMVVTELDDGGARRVVRVNQAFADFLAMPADELIGMSPSSFSHPDDDLVDQAATRDQLAGDSPTYTIEKRYRRRDGGYVWGELHTSLLDHPVPLPDNPDRTARVRISHVVPTGDRRAELVRRDRFERLRRSISELAIDLFAGAHPDGVVDRVATDLVSAFEGAGAALFMRDGVGHGYRLVADIGTVKGDVTRAESLESTDLRMVVPLMTGSETAGRFVVERSLGSEVFSVSDHEAADVYARQLALLFELARNRSTQQRMQVLEDRERIARDLHDTVIQDIFAVGMSVSADIGRVVDTDLRASLENVVDQLDVIIRRVRAVVFQLGRPIGASTRQLMNELTTTVGEAARVLGHQPVLSVHGPIEDLGDHVALELLPTVREALSNIARHADASSSTVTVTIDHDVVTLEVEDDGVGLELVPRRGNGITNIEQRAASLGGAATVSARPGGGCRVEWKVPRR